MLAHVGNSVCQVVCSCGFSECAGVVFGAVAEGTVCGFVVGVTGTMTIPEGCFESEDGFGYALGCSGWTELAEGFGCALGWPCPDEGCFKVAEGL